MRRLVLCATLILALAAPAFAENFDPVLQAKTDGHQAFIDKWLVTPLGAITGAVSFTDNTYTEVACTHYQGDSMAWTGMYLGAEALRYRITQDPAARQNVINLVHYMELAHEITNTPGYIPRFAGPNQSPWNCGAGGIPGQGEFAGDFWIDQTSRDQYDGYMFGMVQAYDAIDDEPTRQIIRNHFREVCDMLTTHEWNIADENGQYTGNHAAWIGPAMRLGWLVAIAHVLDDAEHWTLLDEQYAAMKPLLAVDLWSWYNRYNEFFGNNLRYLVLQSIFRLWPDRARLQEIWEIHMAWNRPWTKGILNPWFDAVHVGGCLRLGNCDPVELAQIKADNKRVLDDFWPAPSYQRAIVCSTQPLDPFSVWMYNLDQKYTWLQQIINVNPQTENARELQDRPWTDMYWQTGDCFAASCNTGEDQTFVGSGFDYVLAYWMNVFYGLLPGDGPYGDDELTDDDQSPDDDASPDDDDDQSPADDDDNDDNDAADDDASPAPHGGNNTTGGCGC